MAVQLTRPVGWLQLTISPLMTVNEWIFRPDSPAPAFIVDAFRDVQENLPLGRILESAFAFRASMIGVTQIRLAVDQPEGDDSA